MGSGLLLTSLRSTGSSRVVLLAAIAAIQLFAQADAIEFGVVSVKPSQLARAGGEGSGRENVAVSPGGVSLTNASLSFCIQWAYGVRFYQVIGPPQLAQDRYDVIARADQPADEARLKIMMQKLLSDCFHLQIRREFRTLPVYELSVRPGAKLVPSIQGEKEMISSTGGHFFYGHITIADFAERLSDLSVFDRPVIDKTGLTGFFNIGLGIADAFTQSGAYAVEQSGFRLSDGKAQIEVIVVEHSEKPTAN